MRIAMPGCKKNPALQPQKQQLPPERDSVATLTTSQSKKSSITMTAVKAGVNLDIAGWPVYFETHNGHCDELLQRCVAHSSHLRDRELRWEAWTQTLHQGESKVRDVQRAHHERGDPVRFVSALRDARRASNCFESRHRQRDGLMRRCVAHSSHLRSVAKPLSWRDRCLAEDRGHIRQMSETFDLVSV